MEGESWFCRTPEQLESAIQDAREKFIRHGFVEIQSEAKVNRTQKQNSSLHRWLREVSLALNNGGYDMRTFLKPGYEIPWDKDGKMAKEHIWRPVQIAMTGQESTTKPDTSQYPQIYEVLNRKLSEYGIHVPWPCKKNQHNG